MHGKKRKTLSEFGKQLKEKQKIQITYGLTENQMRNLFKKLILAKLLSGNDILLLLERRLDNVIFRLSLAPSRAMARQLISHGHIAVNSRKTTASSQILKIGDKIGIKPESLQLPVFQEIDLRLKNFEPPAWLTLDKEKKTAEVKSMPNTEAEWPFNVNLVVEYYSR